MLFSCYLSCVSLIYGSPVKEPGRVVGRLLSSPTQRKNNKVKAEYNEIENRNYKQKIKTKASSL